MSSESNFIRRIAGLPFIFREEKLRLHQIAEQHEFLQEQCDKYRQERDDAWCDVYRLEKELEDALVNKTGSTRTAKP